VTMPQTWTALCTFLAIPDYLGRTVWAALSRAHWSAAVELRQAFLLHEPIPGQGGGRPVKLLPHPLRGLTAHAASPAKMIEALESCVMEKVLSRKDASAFEQCVLDGMSYELSQGGAARWLTLGERQARAARMR
jgi:hypothetical protein